MRKEIGTDGPIGNGKQQTALNEMHMALAIDSPTQPENEASTVLAISTYLSECSKFYFSVQNIEDYNEID